MPTLEDETGNVQKKTMRSTVSRVEMAKLQPGAKPQEMYP